MKRALAACIAFLALAAGLVPSLAFAQSHGGRVVETKLAIYELVASRDMVTLYVDLKGKKGFSTKGAMASFEVINGNGQVVDRAKLLPGDGSTLIARGPFKLVPGKLVATVKFNSQPTEKLSWVLR